VLRGTGGWLIGVVLATALVVAGCGGGSSEPTKSEFVAEANSICQQGVEKKNAALELHTKKEAKENPSGELDQSAKETIIVDVAVPPIREMVNELNDLTLPEEGAAPAEEIIEGMDKTLKEIEADANVALGERSPFEDVDKKAKKYGLAKCQL
jgi:hypothetical protein